VLGNQSALVQFMHNQRDRVSLSNTAGDFSNPLFMLLLSPLDDDLLTAVKTLKSKKLEHVSYAKIDFRELLNNTGFDDYQNYYSSANDIMINSVDIDALSSSKNQRHGHSLYAEMVLHTAERFQATNANQQPEEQSDFLQCISTLFYQIIRVDAKLHLLSAYRKSLFEHTTIRAMSAFIVETITYIIANPNHEIGQLLTDLGKDIDALQALVPEPELILPDGSKTRRKDQHFKASEDLFLECQQLNKVAQGRPIFWFHGGLGGVESYREIATTYSRPFYGIQAKGWMTEDQPLLGIESMAAYYIQAIQSVQPKGPYDLGGFSLGGMIAYEVARQLQLQGESVSSVVMIDTLDSVALKKVSPKSSKTLMLQAANLFLLSTIALDQQRMREAGIVYEDLDFALKDEEFLHQLVQKAKSRGLKLPDKKLKKMIRKVVEVQSSYQINDYQLPALPQPEQIECYYLRNKSGHFLGDLIESVSHMSMLLDPEVSKSIASFCEGVYTQN